MSVENAQIQSDILKIESQLKECHQNNIQPFGNLWNQVKLITCQGVLQKLSYDSLLRLRSIYEMCCILHLIRHDVMNFSTTFNLLENLYTLIKEPSERKIPLYSVQLVYLLSSNNSGDFHSLLGRLNSKERQHPAICNATELEMTLMTGNYSKATQLLQNFSSGLLAEPSKKVLENLRQQLAYSLAHSHESIDINHAKQLLMLESDKKLVEFVQQMNLSTHIIIPASYEENLMEKKTWEIRGDRVHFISASDKPPSIPAAEIINFTLSYASELERII